MSVKIEKQKSAETTQMQTDKQGKTSMPMEMQSYHFHLSAVEKQLHTGMSKSRQPLPLSSTQKWMCCLVFC